MHCEQVRSIVILGQLNKLPAKELNDFELHLASCEECRIYRETVKVVQAEIGRIPSLTPSPFGLKRIKDEALRRTVKHRLPKGQFFPIPRMIYVLPAITLVCFGFVLGLLNQGWYETEISGASSQESLLPDHERMVKLFLYGRDEFVRKNYDGAITQLNQFLRTSSPQDPALSFSAYLTLARSYRELGQYDLAIAAYQRLLMTDESFAGKPNLLIELADCYTKQKVVQHTLPAPVQKDLERSPSLYPIVKTAVERSR